MHKAKYHVTIGGQGWARGPEDDFATVRECRRYAESYGTTADWAEIRDGRGRLIAEHRRDCNGDGTRWFRAYADPATKDKTMNKEAHTTTRTPDLRAITMHPAVSRAITSRLKPGQGVLADHPGLTLIMGLRRRLSNRSRCIANQREDLAATGRVVTTAPRKPNTRRLLRTALDSGLPDDLAVLVGAFLGEGQS